MNLLLSLRPILWLGLCILGLWWTRSENTLLVIVGTIVAIYMAGSLIDWVSQKLWPKS